jgi:hypothetical protein
MTSFKTEKNFLKNAKNNFLVGKMAHFWEEKNKNCNNFLPPSPPNFYKITKKLKNISSFLFISRRKFLYHFYQNKKTAIELITISFLFHKMLKWEK